MADIRTSRAKPAPQSLTRGCAETCTKAFSWLLLCAKVQMGRLREGRIQRLVTCRSRDQLRPMRLACATDHGVDHVFGDGQRCGCGRRRNIADVKHSIRVSKAEIVDQFAAAAERLCAYAAAPWHQVRLRDLRNQLL